ncbi:MAG: phage adsorption protein NrfB [Acidobacteria bacterium]|jgi:adsorption protein B|nr:phage adsorption protein NrfB [Acidobacteriota bacterium]
MSGSDLVALYLVGTKVLLMVTGVVFLVSGLDDLFVDICYWGRSLYRRLFVLPKHPKLTEERLRAAEEQAIAVMIPAWDESAVIRRMLETTLRTLDYSNYHVFVGTYPNDPATHREVEIVREQHPNVHRIVCPKDGPTSKSDCLNWVFQGIRVFEKENGIRFEAVVMNDSEDIVHPLCLRLFNYLIPRKDMVQLPVIPLEPKWSNFTSGHYLDEFAEGHTKDLAVREHLSGIVPAAGVGCGFSRRALEAVAAQNDNQLFNLDSLTEDYDLAFRLGRAGHKGIFVRHAVEREVTRPSRLSGLPRKVKVKEYVAIREYFPGKFRAAMRQKARWIVGIAFQGWAQLGWGGNVWTKYMLIRDRKGFLTNFVGLAAYPVVLTVLAVWGVQWAFPDAYRYPPIVEQGTWLWSLVLANGALLLWRLSHRALYVGRIHGLQQAMLAVPRQVWSNAVNFAAASRALYLFVSHLLTGKVIGWDKTDHVYPSEEELTGFRRRLGDLLLEKRLLAVEQLEEALRLQTEHHRPLGDILVGMRVVDEDALLAVLAGQHRLPAREIDPAATPLELLRRLPQVFAVRFSVYPVGSRGDRLQLAAVHPLSTEARGVLEEGVGGPVDVCLTTRSDLAFAIRRGYQRLQDPAERPLLGASLVDQGLLTDDELSRALKAQRRAYARLGDLLVELRLLTSEQLAAALERYDPGAQLFGEYLVESGYLTRESLLETLERQRTRLRPLGRVLTEDGILPEHALSATLESMSDGPLLAAS